MHQLIARQQNRLVGRDNSPVSNTRSSSSAKLNTSATASAKTSPTQPPPTSPPKRSANKANGTKGAVGPHKQIQKKSQPRKNDSMQVLVACLEANDFPESDVKTVETAVARALSARKHLAFVMLAGLPRHKTGLTPKQRYSRALGEIKEDAKTTRKKEVVDRVFASALSTPKITPVQTADILHIYSVQLGYGSHPGPSVVYDAAVGVSVARRNYDDALKQLRQLWRDGRLSCNTYEVAFGWGNQNARRIIGLNDLHVANQNSTDNLTKEIVPLRSFVKEVKDLIASGAPKFGPGGYNQAISLLAKFGDIDGARRLLDEGAAGFPANQRQSPLTVANADEAAVSAECKKSAKPEESATTPKTTTATAIDTSAEPTKLAESLEPPSVPSREAVDNIFQSAEALSRFEFAVDLLASAPGWGLTPRAKQYHSILCTMALRPWIDGEQAHRASRKLLDTFEQTFVADNGTHLSKQLDASTYKAFLKAGMCQGENGSWMEAFYLAQKLPRCLRSMAAGQTVESLSLPPGTKPMFNAEECDVHMVSTIVTHGKDDQDTVLKIHEHLTGLLHDAPEQEQQV